MSRHRALSWRGLVPRFQRSFVGLGLTTRWTRNFVPTSKIVPMTRRKTDLRLVGWVTAGLKGTATSTFLRGMCR
jgi:hypothetical protein